MTNKKTQKLIESLKGIEGPVLSLKEKEGIKKNLFNRMDAFSAAKFSVDRADRVRIKERIMGILRSRKQKWFFDPRRVLDFGFNNAKVSFVTSFALVVVLVFGMFNFLNEENDVARAATFTSLKNYNGEVFVERDGIIMEVYEGMRLLEGDVVYTFEGGRAVIEYFDSSVSRLSGETKIILNRLVDPKEFSDLPGIEVFVVEGILWSKVLNFKNPNVFFTVESKGIRASTGRAAFNFRVDDNELEIGVFGNSVEVVDEEDISRLTNGKRLLVSNGESRQQKVTDFVYDEDDEWVKENLEYDRRYLSEVENRLLRARAEAVGINIDDKISFNRSLKDNALLFFTFDDVKARKFELDLAEKNFIAAQIKLRHNELDDEEITEINEVIDTFASEVRDFYAFAEKIAYTDEEYAESLKSYVANKVTVNKRDLGVVMPESPVYVVRDVVETLETDSEKGHLLDGDKIVSVLSKLIEIDDIFYKNEEFWDERLADEYARGVFGILSFVENLNLDDENVSELESLLSSKIDKDMERLMAMGFISEGEALILAESFVEEPEEKEVILVARDEDALLLKDEDKELENDEDEILEEDESEDGYFIRGPYGVSIYDDKPVGPMLE